MAIKESDVRTLLDLSPICNKIIDLEGKLQYMSMAGIRRLKITNVEEHYGREYPVSFFPEDVRSELRERCRLALVGQSSSIETRALDTEGSEVWFATTFVPVLDDTGRVKFVIAASVDISEEINYRNHLEQLVVERTQEKTELQQHLFQSQKTRAIGSLAAGIAHDFNNVLGMILGNVELQRLNLQRSNFSVRTLNECFINIETAINRASELSEQLIGFAQKGKYDVRPINVNQLVKELDNLLRAGLNSTQHIEFKTDLQAKRYVEADAVQIHQVIQNLVVNSRDALPNGGEIFVSTKDVILEKEKLVYGDTIRVGEYVLISVKDNGTGIQDDILESIFDPFFSTKARDSGTGLGLASVWGIVTNHGGYIDVDSRIDHGTLFNIYFPAVETQEEERPVDNGDCDRMLCTKVLVVEDEVLIRQVITEFLSLWGCEVIAASNGEDALQIYQDNSIDFVITDLLMESMDGLELFLEIKKIDPDAKVLLMSGYHEDEKIKQAMSDGALGFLKKPFELGELKEFVIAYSQAS